MIGFDEIHCDIVTNTWPDPPQCKSKIFTEKKKLKKYGIHGIAETQFCLTNSSILIKLDFYLEICSPEVFDCGDLYEGQICYAVCPDYQKLSHGNGILFCRSDGSWNDTIPTCVCEFITLLNFMYQNLAKLDI